MWAARARIHDVTTELARSLHVEREGDDVAIVADARDKQGRAYGRYVEFGTHHASPHPFLVPALLEAKRALAEGARLGIETAANE